MDSTSRPGGESLIRNRAFSGYKPLLINAPDISIQDKAGKEGSSISFGVLKMAQALGDRQALVDAGRKVIRLHLEDVGAGLKRLARAVKR